ncbi:hypothetical protein C5B94_03955 [Clavibacter michiganensis]|uniref:hypothetical protein n=1 Tax=Clavibacter michiganensis TaxID=28447 RepID=UPI000CE7B07B|nr:hypothetical protein [Clavibacter michiganensis]PPF56083.1 hypothetical protein C5B94_03955 [Clavibacter michiganensis]
MTVTHPSARGYLTRNLDPYGLISGRPMNRMPRLRFAEGDGDGGDSTSDESGDGDEDADSNKEGDDKPLGPAGERALDRAKDERRAALAELAPYKELGLSVDDIKALRDGKGGNVDIAGIEQRVRDSLTNEFAEREATSARASAVRELAATNGFLNPKQALRLIEAADLEKVTVKDGVADEAGVKKLLDDLAKDSPYLVGTPDSTADARTAGIGASGSGAKPESKPGLDRMRSAYASSAQ